MGFRQNILDSGLENDIVETRKKVATFGANVNLLEITMVSWLGIVSIITVIVFVVVYKKLKPPLDPNGKVNQAFDEEAGPLPSKAAQSSIIDFNINIFSPSSDTPRTINIDTEDDFVKTTGGTEVNGEVSSVQVPIETLNAVPVDTLDNTQSETPSSDVSEQTAEQGSDLPDVHLKS